jgi:hypothetical protein
MSIYQFLRAMRGQRGSASAPTVFVVAEASKSLRLQYTLAFRTNSSLLISRKEQGLAAPVVVHDRQLQHASIKVVDEQPLTTFFTVYRSVYRVLCSIERAVLYFCHYAARKNGARFVQPADGFRLRGTRAFIRNIRYCLLDKFCMGTLVAVLNYGCLELVCWFVQWKIAGYSCHFLREAIKLTVTRFGLLLLAFPLRFEFRIILP